MGGVAADAQQQQQGSVTATATSTPRRVTMVQPGAAIHAAARNAAIAEAIRREFGHCIVDRHQLEVAVQATTILRMAQGPLPPFISKAAELPEIRTAASAAGNWELSTGGATAAAKAGGRKKAARND